MGIAGNEAADTEAKEAAGGDASPPSDLPLMLQHPLPASTSAVRRAYEETIKRDAASHLAKSSRYRRLRAIDSSVPSPHFRKLTAELTRKQASLLIQLRTGHIPLNHHLARIGKVNSPTCPACREKEETVHHFLMTCPAHDYHCRMLNAKLHRDSKSISKLLSHSKAVGPLLHYISATRRLSASFGELIPKEK